MSRASALRAIAEAIISEQVVANVDATAITSTGEGPEVDILLVPHRSLGGLSLVVVAGRDTVRLAWANVTDLSTHDDIDLGLWVSEDAASGDWQRHLRDSLVNEMDRQVEVQLKPSLLGRVRITATIRTVDRERTFRLLGPRKAAKSPAGTWRTSLRTGELPFRLDPPLDSWRRWA